VQIASACFLGTCVDKIGDKICSFYLCVALFQYEGLESSLKDTSFEKESAEAQSLEVKKNGII
jgi:hypothetical protein